ncbi:MFS transporter [Neoactinobaculum massilliense]|uniref:MFS transporter n=1 Tax=Neoactinobaculum massilliense TaxID=2364794 RepID=UPI0013DDF473|nr:MFS transporter [Neoactinobaculum massilliense]
MRCRSLSWQQGGVAVAGGVSTASQIIGILMMLFGGVIVDRSDRRALMYWRAVTGAVLWMLLGILLVLGVAQLWHVIAIVIAVQFSFALLSNSDEAALRSILTDNEEYARARGINQGRDAVVSIAGGPLGGFLYGAAHWLPFIAASVLHAIYGLCAALIRTDLQPTEITRKSTKRIGSIFEDIAVGLRFLVSSRVRLGIVLWIAFAQTAANMLTFTTIYQLMGHGYSAAQVALVEVSMAVGMIVASAAASIAVTRVPSGCLAILSTIGLLVAAVGATVWHSYGMLFVWFGIAGLTFPIGALAVQGFLFASTPDNLQGRAQSSLTVVSSIFAVWAPLVASALVVAGQTTMSYGLAAALFVLGLTAIFCAPAFRKLGTASEWSKAESAASRAAEESGEK